MDGFNAGADSQAAYAAMPNQGLAPTEMSPQTKALVAAALQGIPTGAQKYNQMVGQALPMPQNTAMPAQTLSAGQIINPTAQYMGGR